MDDARQRIKRGMRRDDLTAQDWLLNYASRKQEYYKAEAYISGQSGKGRRGRGKGGSPVEYQFIHVADVEQAEQWLLAVESLVDYLPPNRRLFVELWRKCHELNNQRLANHEKKMEWVVWVQRKYAEEMARRTKKDESCYWLTEATLYLWRHKVINELVRVAYMRGCKF